MSRQPYFNRSQWIRFRAEQLAQRREMTEFVHLYTARSMELGFPGYAVANQAFRDFLEPYVIEARRAWEAETRAWFEHAYYHNHGLEKELQGLQSTVVDPEEDEDQNEEEHGCDQCGVTIVKNEGDVCDDCEAKTEMSFGEY